MARTFTVPVRESVNIAEDVADDILQKVLDLPSILYTAVTAAVHTAAQQEKLDVDRTWHKVYNAVYDELNDIFEQHSELDHVGCEDFVWIDDRLGLEFENQTELEAIKHYLAETILDGIAEYDLMSNEQWFEILDLLKIECRTIDMSPTFNKYQLNVVRRKLYITQPIRII